MSDHINIHERGYRHRDAQRYRLQLAQIEAELKLVKDERDQYASDLDAIFTRIARGDPVELHLAEGDDVFIITGKPR